MNKRIFLLLATVSLCGLLLSSCSNSKTVQKAIVYITNLKEGSVEEPVSKKIVLTGTVTNGDWLNLSNALLKENTLIYLDFSKCTCGTQKGDDEITDCIFNNNPTLSGITFPEGLKKISEDSFNGCPHLKTIYFPHTSLSSIGTYSFNQCSELNDVHFYKYNNILSCCFNGCENIAVLDVSEQPFLLDYSFGYAEENDRETVVKEVHTPNKTLTFNDWKKLCEDLYSEKVSITFVNAIPASSSASNICNKSWESWETTETNSGIGESIECTFSNPTTVSFFTIKNGSGDLASYYKENRIKEAELILDDDSSTKTTITLQDSPLPQNIQIDQYSKKYAKAKFTIKSIYPGTVNNAKTYLDEIVVNGTLWDTKFYKMDDLKSADYYIYNSETSNMLLGLYAMDVGEDNVQLSNEGLVQERITDPETNESYWIQPVFCLEDHFYSNYIFDTGAGGESYYYKLFLIPTGNHLLFTWHESSNGTNEEYQMYVTGIYVWKNHEWTTAQKGELSLEDCINEFDSDNFIDSFHKYIDSESSSENNEE